ncbi:hypothetical protein XENOCAPTIV_015447 [Xenoophorus captivus]|uniref:Secreted protein n=1 Tax=Xenoophorus captivus TaxID=1517983 RepID=A0ABV0QVQ1_9TELE
MICTAVFRFHSTLCHSFRFYIKQTAGRTMPAGTLSLSELCQLFSGPFSRAAVTLLSISSPGHFAANFPAPPVEQHAGRSGISSSVSGSHSEQRRSTLVGCICQVLGGGNRMCFPV